MVSSECPCAYQNYITYDRIDQNADQPPYDSEMGSDMSEEEAYNLEDVSSDVEIPAQELQELEDDAE